MCLIVFAWRPGHTLPLVVASNRDEFHARPSAALGAWPDAPGVYAGRDLEAGGSWMGIGPGRRFAAVTNIRSPGSPVGIRSRGELVAGFLSGALTLQAYVDSVQPHAYSGFNLLLSDGEQLCYLSSQHAPRPLALGVYGLSNANLDTPWPKLLRARHALSSALPQPEPEALFALLANADTPTDGELPDTGVGLATERVLSTAFIQGEHYGTRASTVLYCHANGERVMYERRFGPFGVELGDTQVQA